MIDLQPLGALESSIWDALLDITERVPKGSTLIGGQMVLLRGLEKQRIPPRISEDLDLVADVRVRPPVLAAIHHSCIGGGVDMICCADMRYATRDAFFSIREIDIGMTADVGTLQRLPKLVPDGVARELAYTGRDMPAAEAVAVGLVNQVFEDRAAMLAEVTAIARTIAAKSPLAVRGSKEMLLYSRDHTVRDALNYVATWNAGMFSQADIQAGLAAQRQRKPAVYQD